MSFSDEADWYHIERDAIYNSGVITCQVPPLAMMYIFSWDIIHSAMASIYYCHDCAQTAWENDLSLKELDPETEKETCFSSAQSISLSLQCRFRAEIYSWPTNRLVLGATKTALRVKMAASQWRAERLPALLEFRLDFLSLSTPGQPPAHAFPSFFPFLPFIKIICSLNFTLETSLSNLTQTWNKLGLHVSPLLHHLSSISETFLSLILHKIYTKSVVGRNLLSCLFFYLPFKTLKYTCNCISFRVLWHQTYVLWYVL